MWGFPLLIPHLFFLVQIWGYGKTQLEKWKNLIGGWKPQTIEKRDWGFTSVFKKISKNYHTHNTKNIKNLPISIIIFILNHIKRK